MIHFKDFTYKHKVHVITDHKSLISLFKKSLTSASPRLSGMLLSVLDFQLELMYQSGTKMHLIDALVDLPVTMIPPKPRLSQFLTFQYMMLKFSQKCLFYHWLR